MVGSPHTGQRVHHRILLSKTTPNPAAETSHLHRQRNALLLDIDIQHLDLDGVADGEHLGGMLDEL